MIPSPYPILSKAKNGLAGFPLDGWLCLIPWPGWSPAGVDVLLNYECYETY